MHTHINTLLDLETSLFTLMVCIPFSVSDPSLIYIISNEMYFMQLNSFIQSMFTYFNSTNHTEVLGGE